MLVIERNKPQRRVNRAGVLRIKLFRPHRKVCVKSPFERAVAHLFRRSSRWKDSRKLYFDFSEGVWKMRVPNLSKRRKTNET